ncbi:hypothetical protein EJB05_46350, partial [Eragrostis curvula]
MVLLLVWQVNLLDLPQWQRRSGATTAAHVDAAEDNSDKEKT